MTMTELLTRMRTALAEAVLFPPVPDDSAERAGDALQDVTRWAWLPPLSGVAVAGDHVLRTRGNDASRAGNQAEETP